MKEFKINFKNYVELCSCGRLFFNEHNIFNIAILTFMDKIAVIEDIRTKERTLVKLVVTKE